ncbi:MAG: 50S ribosomal protein L3 [Candidatus Parvarchaeota archaeon]|nr:50S ribosomal protein L3 [Candidatus Jingweiarchaeum tengchongense]MCW1297805.1 50S ribosomal protein L3 [Candidatus Jingweiarchaeum tengchongense]MCW1299815.1 50S ribosomal protein L3 [Candidatus Jingweiarchaeum tengchongense]MCW1304214.1 50S ribosomal protein L3 [Candidatus Jingweiarchaeum tengchongense]MCW1305242.1 50S ribosomal protein L3 [Candidatus Jingweiarchaeum tengchongense]
MGHKVGRKRYPHRGSLAYWPRVRAKRIYPRIKNWPEIEEKRILGFAGYKVGMTHAIVIDDRKHSPTKGEIALPVTIIETPPLKIFGIRFYRMDQGKKEVFCDILSDSLSKDLERKIKIPKKRKELAKEFEKIEANINKICDLRILAHTQPRLAKLKKKPEIFEIAIGGKDIKEKIEFARSILGKEIKVNEVLKEGEQVDVIAVTKGKGIQGPIMRHGMKILTRKTKRVRRKPGALSPWRPYTKTWRVGRAGQMGFQTRTELNKVILKISSNPAEINKSGGFLNYGNVNTDYMLIAGSVPGSRKRLLRFRLAVRPSRKTFQQAPKIVHIAKGA